MKNLNPISFVHLKWANKNLEFSKCQSSKFYYFHTDQHELLVDYENQQQ